MTDDVFIIIIPEFQPPTKEQRDAYVAESPSAALGGKIFDITTAIDKLLYDGVIEIMKETNKVGRLDGFESDAHAFFLPVIMNALMRHSHTLADVTGRNQKEFMAFAMVQINEAMHEEVQAINANEALANVPKESMH